MNPTKIYRSYKRTIQVVAPNGREQWLTHEAGMEATLEPNDDLPECHKAIEEMCKAEVHAALKADAEKFKTSSAAPTRAVPRLA